MTILLKITGKLDNSKIKLELNVPDNWNPDYIEYTKTIGAIQSIMYRLDTEFNKFKSSDN